MDVRDVPVAEWSPDTAFASQWPGKITRPPLNQGDCGACWAIAAASCFADRANLALDKSVLSDMTARSEDCITYGAARGCNSNCQGGYMIAGFLFIQREGLLDVVPARGRHKCGLVYRLNLFDTFGVTNRTFIDNPRLTAAELEANANNIAHEIFMNGPVCATFNMFSNFVDFWKKEPATAVYRLSYSASAAAAAASGQNASFFGKDNDTQGSKGWSDKDGRGPQGQTFITAHSIVIIGYGETPVTTFTMVKNDGKNTPVDSKITGTQKYWVCRNSWGAPSNRPNGLFRIARGENMCGIESDVLACCPLPPPAKCSIELLGPQNVRLVTQRRTTHSKVRIALIALAVVAVVVMIAGRGHFLSSRRAR